LINNVSASMSKIKAKPKNPVGDNMLLYKDQEHGYNTQKPA